MPDASNEQAAEHYALMLNALRGLEDDLGANEAPLEAIELMRRVIAICEADFRDQFPRA